MRLWRAEEIIMNVGIMIIKAIEEVAFGKRIKDYECNIILKSNQENIKNQG